MDKKGYVGGVENNPLRMYRIAIIILAVLLAGLLLFQGYEHVFNIVYLAGREDLIIDMNKFSYFPVIIKQGNQTIIKNTALQEICGG